MKMIFFGIIIFGFVTAFAKETVNDNDKTETYKIILKDSQVGTITVSSFFTGDGIMETTEIKFLVKCASGYKLNPKFSKNNILHTYDYGANGKLSAWDSVNQVVTIFYRTAKILDSGEPAFDKAKTLEVSVKEACRK